MALSKTNTVTKGAFDPVRDEGIRDKSGDQTRLKIISAAAKLFDAQGYKGTSVRQIAQEANVNVALISYHFHGKQGLLEVLISGYFERLFQRFDEQEKLDRNRSAFERLTTNIRLYVYYQRDHASVTRLIQRELSVESMLAREVMTLYSHRFKHAFAKLIEEGMATGEMKAVFVDSVLLSMASLLIYPYVNVQSVREVYYLEPLSDEFCERLVASTNELMRSLLLPSASFHK